MERRLVIVPVDMQVMELPAFQALSTGSHVILNMKLWLCSDGSGTPSTGRAR